MARKGVQIWLGVALLLVSCYKFECAASNLHRQVRREAITEASLLDPSNSTHGEDPPINNANIVDVQNKSIDSNTNKTDVSLTDKNNNVVPVKDYQNDQSTDESKEISRGKVKYGGIIVATTSGNDIPTTTLSSPTINNFKSNDSQVSSAEKSVEQVIKKPSEKDEENIAITTSPSGDHDTGDSDEYDEEDDTPDEEKNHSTEEKNRDDHGRSFDIEKYVSPEFHNINNVYTHPTSPEVERYASPDWADDHLTTKKDSTKTLADIYNTELTTPKIEGFDKQHQTIAKEIKANLEVVDKHFTDSEKTSPHDQIVDVNTLLTKVSDNDTDVSINYLNSASVVLDDNESKNTKQKSVVIQNGTNFDYESKYIKTVTEQQEIYKETSLENENKVFTEKARSQPEVIEKYHKSNDSTPQTSTTKPRVRISLKNNKIANSENESSTELDSNEKNTIPKKPTLKWKPYFLSTPMPRVLDPVYDKNTTTPENQSSVQNTVINLTKRGSTRYVDTFETTTPKISINDGQTFTIPPSAAAWSLASMKEVPTTKKVPVSSELTDSTVQENQIFTVQVLPPSNATQSENVTVLASVLRRTDHPDEIFTTTTETVPTTTENGLIITSTMTVQSSERTTKYSIEEVTGTSTQEFETTPDTTEASVSTTFVQDLVEKAIHDPYSDVTSKYIEPTTYKPTYIPKFTLTTPKIFTTTNEITTKSEEILTTISEEDPTTLFSMDTTTVETETLPTTITYSTITDPTIVETTTEESEKTTELPNGLYSTTTGTSLSSRESTEVSTTTETSTPAPTTMEHLALFESTENITSSTTNPVNINSSINTNRVNNNLQMMQTTRVTPSSSREDKSEEIINNNSVYSKPNLTTITSTQMTPESTLTTKSTTSSSSEFDVKFKVVTQSITGENTSLSTTSKATDLNVKLLTTTERMNNHHRPSVPTDYDDTTVEIVNFPESSTLPHNLDVKHEHKNVENDVNKFSTHKKDDSSDPTTQLPKTTDTEPIIDNNNGMNDSENNAGIIAAIVISSIAGVSLILLALLLTVMRKRQKRFNYGQRCTPVSLDAYSLDSVSVYNSVRRKGAVRASKRSYGNPAFEDPVSITHPMNFAALSTFAIDTETITKEYEEVPQVTAHTNEVPQGCETKNRYANVIPLPETRVYLTKVEGDQHSDYINANFIRGPRNAKAYYIATQAPMENTVDDFWKMIWEQQSKVILMLTDLIENGVEKCFDYLPPSEVLDCHRQFGDYQITLKKREVKDKYIISSLQLKNMVSNSWREVTHLWYLGWPERGVPAEANSIIAFLIEARSYLKTSNNHVSTESDPDKTTESSNGYLSGANGDAGAVIGPVTVHCSPGTGRTGTVVACDVIIREFELTRLVDVPKTVYRIRRDRASAVQTKDQYAFIYKVIHLYATKLTGGALDSI